MKIGLTYDLRSEYLAAGYTELETAEFDRPDTIDAIENALNELGFETDRIGHARQLIDRLACGDRRSRLAAEGGCQPVPPAACGGWDLVFNICEGLHGPAREAQVPAILDVYGIPYTFSDPLLMSLCLHKGLTKTVIRDAGIPTPRFALVQEAADIRDVNLRYPLFAKPVAEGTGKGVAPSSRIQTAAGLRDVCEQLLAEYRQPVLVEEFLPGREFTVGLLGTGADARVLGTLEIILLAQAEPGVYSYVNKEQCEELVECRLVRADEDAEVRLAESIALDAWRALGCRDSGRVDLRSDADGHPEFMEVNPLAGLHPFHSDLPMLCTALGMPYVQLIDGIVQSALKRVRISRHTERLGGWGRSAVGGVQSESMLSADRPQ